MSSILGPYGPVILKRLIVNATGTGDMTIVPSVPGKRLVIINIYFTSKKATVLTVKSWPVTLLSGPMEVNAGQVVNLRDGMYGLFETAIGEAFIFNVTGAGQTLAGFVIYCEY